MAEIERAIDRAAMAVFEHKPTTGRRRLTDDTATAREIAEVVLEAAGYQGAVAALQEIRDLLHTKGGGPLPWTGPARDRIDAAIDALLGGQ